MTEPLTDAEKARVRELLRLHAVRLPESGFIMRSSWDHDASSEDHALMDRAAFLAEAEQNRWDAS